MKVMLVDDSDIARALLRKLLSAIDAAFITGEFSGPTAAIAGIRNDPPDIVFLDIQLEDGCGMDVLKVVSAEYPRIKFIVVSNYADRVFREHYENAGAYRFFDKSLELEALRICLEELALAESGTGVVNAAASHDLDLTESNHAPARKMGGIMHVPALRKTPLALIVDDDPFIRLLTRDALERFGWQVEEASDGASGLAAITKLHPDIVLLDVMMPGMDGFAVCRALRMLPGGELVPVLMLTGLGQVKAVEKALSCGANGYISKPFDLNRLTATVRKWLENPGGQH